MKLVDTKELFTKLFNQNGATFVGLLTEVIPPMRKTGNPYLNKVTKRQFHNVQIGFNYTNAINNRRDKEGEEKDFVASPRKWGRRINGTPIVEHVKSGEYGVNYYLETRVLNSQKPDYYLNGVKLNNEVVLNDVLSFMSKKHSNAEHQGVENEVIVRDFRLDSIIAVTLNKETYIVEP